MPNPEKQNIEFELTFLARYIPSEIRNVEPSRLVDVYIPDGHDIHSQLRLRKSGNKYEITKKQPVKSGDASEQTEYTIPLNENEFIILSSVSNKRIEKDRYRVIIDGHVAEVDVFMVALIGLVLIDYEFKSNEDKDSFIPPECCLAEVTQEDFVAGGNIAGKSYTDIANDLARYNYVPLNI